MKYMFLLLLLLPSCRPTELDRQTKKLDKQSPCMAGVVITLDTFKEQGLTIPVSTDRAKIALILSIKCIQYSNQDE